MPNYYQSKRVAARMPLSESDGAGDAVIIVSEFLVPATALGVGDIIEFSGIPAYHVLTGIKVQGDIVDSNGTPTITFDLDFLTGYPGDLAGLQSASRTMSNLLNPGAAGVPLRAGGELAYTGVNIAKQVASTADRNIGLKITAAAATQVTGARIRVHCSYMADPGLLS